MKKLCKRNSKRILSIVLTMVVLLTSIKLDAFVVNAEETESYVTLYLMDNTAEKWIGNDNAVIELVDNSSGHDSYIMKKIDDTTWSVRVPESAYNITFNRYNADKTTQWNSWSAGGRDANNAYYADGSEYGHWEVVKESDEYFHAGDTVYLDISEFTTWATDSASMYINFTDATKEENGGKDITISTAESAKYNPQIVNTEAEQYIYEYVVTAEDEGTTELRFWRGNETTLWNYSVELSYEEYAKGNNCIKVIDWNDAGNVAEYVQKDTDNDVLPDDYEIDTLYPILILQGKGLHDIEEINPEDDYDEDGLTNGEEYEEGTNPGAKDTDGDGLNDYEEVKKYHTKPLLYDTDEDGLGDGTEVVNGFDPLKKDTDNNGTLDGKEKIENQILTDQVRESLDTGAMSAVPDLTITGSGDYSFRIRMEDYSYNENYASLDYLVSEVTRISHNSDMEFDSATITYHIGEEILKDNKIEDLSIVRLEENKVIPIDTTYNKEQNIISAKVDELCDYAVENKKEREYNTDITNLSSVIEKGKADVVFAIDTTGSMGSTIRNVKNNLQSIAAKLDEKDLDIRFGLVEYRDITVDGKDSTKDHGWFTSAEAFKTEIGALSVAGGGDRPESAVDALDKVKSMTYRKNYGKYIVLITDAPYKNGTATNASLPMSTMIEELKKENYIVSVVSYSYYKSTYTNLYNSTNGIYADITGNFFEEINPLLDKIDKEVNDEDYEWVRLSNYELVKISKDPTVDSDGDGIPDRMEVSEEEFSDTIGVMMRAYRSHPLEADTDGDGIDDGEDSQPLTYNVTVKAVNADLDNPIVTLNTGKAFQVFFNADYTINDFLRKYNTKALQLDKAYLEGIYDTLASYKRYNFNRDELVCIGMLDEGVMKFIAQDKSYKEKCALFERVVGQEPRIETTQKQYKFLLFEKTETVTVDEVLEYFKLESAGESWRKYFLVAIEQIGKGKYAEETNAAGTIGEIGVAFTGVDVVQDVRDLSYDVTHWEWSWGHVGETALDGLGLVPIVGVLAKGDTAMFLIKHSDKIYEFRRVAKIEDLLSTIKKIDTKVTGLVGSAKTAMKRLGKEASLSLYRALDNLKYNDNRYALATGYDTINLKTPQIPVKIGICGVSCY